LYEYGLDMRPFGSSQLRLIRPLTHPEIREKVEVTFGRELGSRAPDLVFVDRLWRYDVRPADVTGLAEEIHRQGGKLIYWFDDNFSEVSARVSADASQRKDIFRAFLDASDGYVVTTPALCEAFTVPNKKICIIPNTLDERLIVPRTLLSQNGYPKTVIGYMGTPTHDDDLRMIVPALRMLNEKYPGRLQFQIVGALPRHKLNQWEEMKRLPLEILQPDPVEIEYPPFMVWFTGTVAWDIALAPLIDTPFNRAKSDVKFLDYTAAGAPGVYSAVDAYVSSVEQRKTGILAENDPIIWAEAIEELILDPGLRVELIQNATNYLYGKRTIQNFAEEWLKTVYEFV